MKALVISGGGSKGAFGGGVAQYLIEEKNREYDLLIGTSTGSLLVPFLAVKKLDKLKEVYTNVTQEDIISNPWKEWHTNDIQKIIEDFEKAMNDDFNTPEAYSVLFDMAREVNRLKTESIEKASELGALMRELADVIGILYQDPEAFLKGDAGNDDEVAEIEALIKLRNDSRAAKDWANADMARDKLTEMGIVLEDGPEGTTWRRK